MAKIKADFYVGGVPVNPVLPEMFDSTPNEERPKSHMKFWDVPFIVTTTVEELDKYYAERTDEYADAGRQLWAEQRKKWLEAYPSGTRYEVRCLDGGAWDRSSNWGAFNNIDDAVTRAGGSPEVIKKPRGRPATGKAKSTAERQAEFRARRKADGICPCCGQKIPLKD